MPGSTTTEDEHRRVAAEMHARWEAGEAKSQLEIEYWGDATSHGKAFTAYVKRWLGKATERKSAQTRRIEELEDLSGFLPHSSQFWRILG